MRLLLCEVFGSALGPGSLSVTLTESLGAPAMDVLFRCCIDMISLAFYEEHRVLYTHSNTFHRFLYALPTLPLFSSSLARIACGLLVRSIVQFAN